MKKLFNRAEQTKKFLNWSAAYPGWLQLICTPNHGCMSPQTMKMLVERLADESFYEIIFVMLEVHRNTPYVKDLAKTLLLDMMIEKWQNDKEELIQKIVAGLE